ncbi:MAG: PQQ-binding-like beta-propeller repeat protein, partial [Spirochaetia bacterium]|nr:PQQ-binding-like beta-propeller repeat protein [Spirochaetia bacterium]
MKLNLLLFAGTLALQLGFAADWPIYRGNVFFTGNNDEVAPTNTRIFYTVKTDAKIFYPIISDGVVFFTTGAGCLYAIDEETGELRFRVKMQSPAIRQSVIYGSNLIAADTQWLYDYDKKSGTILWARKDDDNGIYTTPTLADNTVFYGSRKRLFAKRLDNGHDQWAGIPLTLYGGFANVYGNLLLIPTRDPSGKSGALAAVNTSTGKTQWQKSIPYAIKATAPVIYNEVVYLTVASNLMAFKTATGDPIFDEGHGEYIVDHPVFSDASIFLPLRDGSVSVADLKTGKRKSLRKTEFKSGVNLLLIRDNLYATGADIRTYGEKTSTVSKLVGYDLNSGKIQFEFESPTPGGAGPPIASKGRFFLAVENVLYVIGQDGLAWFGKEKIVDFSKDPCPEHPENGKVILIAEQSGSNKKSNAAV